MSEWRFHLMTLPEGEWVDRDLQLQNARIIEALSAPADISGRLPLGYRMIDAPSGKRALVEWGAAIVAEQEGRDPIFAIVDDLSTEGDWLLVGAGGFTSYPTGMPWTDKQLSSTKIDPLEVVRKIWASLQAHPSGDLGVIVDAVKSNTYLGKPEGQQLTAAKVLLAYLKDQLDYTEDQAKEDAILVQQHSDAALVAAGLPKGGLLVRSVSAPTGDKRSKRNLWFKGSAAAGITEASKWNGKKWILLTDPQFDVAVQHFFNWEDQKLVLKTSKQILSETKKEHSDQKSVVSGLSEQEAAPYTLSWWDTHDLGSVISDLAAQTPFDYREHTAWDGDDALTHRLLIGYPEFGVRREHLRLEIGVNVTAPPPLTESEYASEVLVLGAGEGRTMVRSTAASNPGRLRRIAVVERKELSNSARAQAVARTEVSARNAEWTFDFLSLVDHPMCPYGSFEVGDYLYLTGDAGWMDIAQWVRVQEIEIDCVTGALGLKVSSN